MSRLESIYMILANSNIKKGGKRAPSRDGLSLSLRLVIYQEGGFWIAHCLELDIVAEGQSRKEAMTNLKSLCGLQIETAIEENEVESVFRPAPSEFWKLFFSGKKTATEQSSNKTIERFETRIVALA